MVKQFFKKRSKRLTCRKKYKIERKVREHNRKKKKEAKNNPNNKSKRKDVAVPNSLPFKEEILKEAEDRKRRLEEEQQRLKDKRKKDRQKILDKKRNLASFAQDAQKRTAEYERKNALCGEGSSLALTGGKSVESSLKAYYKEFKKVIEAADVILEVLDARDPVGSRCPQVEQAVINAGTNKKLVLVLNKIDLVPKENVEKWLTHLRNELPTVAFKASTQTQKENLGQSRGSLQKTTEDLLKSSRCVGADALLKLLGNYCRNQDIRTAITVGIVGFPNTGKSSIINSLKRCKACGVGATPGFTKTMQEVHLDKHIKLLDSPGIVMATGSSDASVILRNCVKIETLPDPISPVEAIMRRCSKQQLMLHYNVPDYKDVQEFLSLLATKMGRLKKGGVPDVDKAAKTVLQDWTSGKITYYTHPPEQHSLPVHLDAAIVTQLSAAFDVESLMKEDEDTLRDLKSVSSMDIVVESAGPTDGIVTVEEEEAEKMEEEEEETEELKDVTVSMETKPTKKSSSKVTEKKKQNSENVLSLNQQVNRERKQDFKKMKKKRKRADALAGELSKALDGAMSGLGAEADEDYDFGTDFK
ncbi:guanine nucleotide-binding protein-like 3 homolog [Lingula anatina]|uniref:Guanine nucleotide-binding protein-like 3 homolog n=1 Tax=Lingula anatina TaxID=7574 RepID=A0A1S3H987_LINAN|nr:guanine nucleotide-binding protein-like 3 homolog [Lingula anatina]|eukprot:XP_013382041.1 guanine nucleotide-binding protein-like 3 homolog [Lingula anatina]